MQLFCAFEKQVFLPNDSCVYCRSITSCNNVALFKPFHVTFYNPAIISTTFIIDKSSPFCPASERANGDVFTLLSDADTTTFCATGIDSAFGAATDFAGTSAVTFVAGFASVFQVQQLQVLPLICIKQWFKISARLYLILLLIYYQQVQPSFFNTYIK